MALEIRSALLTLSLIAVPVGFAAAQATAPTGGTSTTAPSYPGSGGTADSHGTMAPSGSVVGENHGAASDPRHPGATGESIVKGDSSTIHGDRKATSSQKSGTMSQ